MSANEVGKLTDVATKSTRSNSFPQDSPGGKVSGAAATAAASAAGSSPATGANSPGGGSSGCGGTGDGSTSSKEKIGVPIFCDESGTRRMHLAVDLGPMYRPRDVIVQVRVKKTSVF